MEQDFQKLMEDTFENIVQIGAGGGGTVYKAHHKRLDKDVVLKKIHSNQLQSIDRRGELNILKDLKHNYIPQIFDFMEYGDDVFTVMEYIPGKSFAQLLEEKRKFTQKETAKWLLQLCEVVEYLHSQTPPIIHCDIKPANVMLTPQGNICLIDFNISGVKSQEGLETIGYTKSYAPVEQFGIVAKRAEARLQQNSIQGVNNLNRSETVTEDDKTEVVSDMDEDITDVVSDDVTDIDDCTEIEQEEIGKKNEKTTPISGNMHSPMRGMSDAEWSAAKGILDSVGNNCNVDERTDIYSIGATMYHIITGRKPKPFYEEQVPILEIDANISEVLAFIIEKAMEVKPSSRFKSSQQMLKVVQNMGTMDKRYKSIARKQIITSIFMGIMIIVSVAAMTLGRSTMRLEKEELYNQYIENMNAARMEMNYDSVKENYQEALQISTQKQDAYYILALSYFEQKQYEECINYLSNEVYSNGDILLDNDFGRFYYITGSCFFEMDDYKQAIAYYEKALQLQSDEIAYYRDYVIALARIGELDKATETLATAESKGVTADVLLLLNGEIADLRGDYQQGTTDLLKCIDVTSDDYVKLRAFTKLDDIYIKMYQETQQYEERIKLLETALAVLPAEYQVTLMERLAQVFIDYSDIADTEQNCEKAIALFEDMDTRGYGTFTSQYNIAILYEKMGRHDSSKAQLEAMLKRYEDNYNIYKRLAFVELGIQAAKENKDRDYVKFSEYYETANTLYKEKAAMDDVEMLSLQQLYEDVVANGWLEVR
ncbi:MAG: protein kinase [Lachnospiraceae bacterium]|nr:protein kinase [Lachnospiraceae bacterium]